MHTCLRFVLLGVVVVGSGCAAFLRGGHVEDAPEGRRLVLPQATVSWPGMGEGQTHEVTPTLVRRKDGSVELELAVKKHLVGAAMPVSCDQVVLSGPNEAMGGVAAPLSTDFGGDVQRLRATFAAGDVTPFAKADEAVKISFCEVGYSFNGRGLEDLMR